MILLLALLAATFHLPRLQQPFGGDEINAGLFFGIVNKNFASLGFAELRGAPVGWKRWHADDRAIPYLHHPPGLFWWMTALGTAEWAHRAPTVLCALVAALLLFALLRPRLGTFAAAVAAATLLGVPSFTLYSQASYETVVVAFGLLLWWTHARFTAAAIGARAGWAVAVAATAFAGAWMDWSFVLFCLALPIVTASRAVGRTLRDLALPAAAAGLAAATIVVWQDWASQSPHLLQDMPRATVRAMLENNILQRPPIDAWLAGAASLIPATASMPVACAALLGLPLLFRRAPRLALATMFAGIAHFTLFATHATNHPHFYCFFTVPLAAAVGAIATLGADASRLRRGAAVVAIALTASAWFASAKAVAANDTDYFRDLGRVLDTAATGEGRSPYGRVLHNAPRVYPYYVESPDVWIPPTTQLATLKALCDEPQRSYDMVFLWYAKASGPGAREIASFSDAGIADYLVQFDKRRVRDLEQTIEHGLWGTRDVIEEVYLVTIPPKGR